MGALRRSWGRLEAAGRRGQARAREERLREARAWAKLLQEEGALPLLAALSEEGWLPQPLAEALAHLREVQGERPPG